LRAYLANVAIEASGILAGPGIERLHQEGLTVHLPAAAEPNFPLPVA